MAQGGVAGEHEGGGDDEGFADGKVIDVAGDGGDLLIARDDAEGREGDAGDDRGLCGGGAGEMGGWGVVGVGVIEIDRVRERGFGFWHVCDRGHVV